jgi:hypothetical protein
MMLNFELLDTCVRAGITQARQAMNLPDAEDQALYDAVLAKSRESLQRMTPRRIIMPSFDMTQPVRTWRDIPLEQRATMLACLYYDNEAYWSQEL